MWNWTRCNCKKKAETGALDSLDKVLEFARDYLDVEDGLVLKPSIEAMLNSVYYRFYYYFGPLTKRDVVLVLESYIISNGGNLRLIDPGVGV